MQNPFDALGLGRGATTEQVRAAYHARVKLCHPDGIAGDQAKQVAQDQLVQLNLAYAEAIRQASYREHNAVVVPDAKQVAKKLLEQGHYDSALRILNKALDRDAEWFVIKGNILLKQGEPEAAHACYRTAVRLDPDNAQYRELALSAGVQMRKQKTIRGRMSCWARGIVGKMT